MNRNIPVQITIIIAAGFAYTCAMGDETTPIKAAASSLQMSAPDSPPNTNNKLDKEKEDVLAPESSDQALDHSNRAVSSIDFESLSESSPGTDIHRAKVMQPVKGGVEAEVITPPRTEVPPSLQHSDRDDTQTEPNDEKSQQKK